MSQILINALRETLVMLGMSGVLSIVIGISLAISVTAISSSHYKVVQTIHFIMLGTLQLARSIPFLLLLVLFIPVTNWLITKQIAYNMAIIIPLTVAGSLLLAYQVNQILQELNAKWRDTSKALGATSRQIITFILLPEAMPQIAKASTKMLEILVGFTTIAGALGAGGLGQLAIEKSLGEPDHLCVLLSILALIAIQQIIKYTGSLAQTQSG